MNQTLILSFKSATLKEPISTFIYPLQQASFFTFVKNVCFQLACFMGIVVVIGVIQSIHFYGVRLCLYTFFLSGVKPMDFNNNINSSSVAHLLKTFCEPDDANEEILLKKMADFRSTLDEKQRDNFEAICYLITENIAYISKKSYRDGVYEGIEIAETNFRNEIKRRRAENRKKQKKSGEE